MEVEIELYINAWFRFSGTMCIRKYGLMPAQPRNVFGLLWNKTTTRLPNVSRSTLVGWTDEESRRNRRMDPDSAWCNAERRQSQSTEEFWPHLFFFFFFISYTFFFFDHIRISIFNLGAWYHFRESIEICKVVVQGKCNWNCKFFF